MVAGTQLYNDKNPYRVQVRRVRRILTHYGYTDDHVDNEIPLYDIAMVVVNWPFSLTDYVQTVQLPKAEDSVHRNEILNVVIHIRDFVHFLMQLVKFVNWEGGVSLAYMNRAYAYKLLMSRFCLLTIVANSSTVWQGALSARQISALARDILGETLPIM